MSRSTSSRSTTTRLTDPRAPSRCSVGTRLGPVPPLRRNRRPRGPWCLYLGRPGTISWTVGFKGHGILGSSVENTTGLGGAVGAQTGNSLGCSSEFHDLFSVMAHLPTRSVLKARGGSLTRSHEFVEACLDSKGMKMLHSSQAGLYRNTVTGPPLRSKTAPELSTRITYDINVVCHVVRITRA